MFKLEQKGDFKNAERFFKNVTAKAHFRCLEKYAKQGVDALAAATPELTGLTSNSWKYDIIVNTSKCEIHWYNTNDPDGFDVAIGLQYGHGTRNGGYVKGIDYINPALRPIFEKLVSEVWLEVTK